MAKDCFKDSKILERMNRSYRKPITLKEASQIIEKGTGTKVSEREIRRWNNGEVEPPLDYPGCEDPEILALWARRTDWRIKRKVRCMSEEEMSRKRRKF